MVVASSRLEFERGSRGDDRVVVERAGERVLVVVADGAGGAGGGARAAQAACDAIVTAFRGGAFDAGTWNAHLRIVDSLILTAGHGGTSTAVVAEIADGQVFGASVGDSGAWLVSMARAIDLTERQVRKPLLGTGVAAPMPFGPVPMVGRLLVGTDGLFKYAPRSRLTSCTLDGTVDTATAALVDLVRLKSGRLQDDVAVVICEQPT